MAVVVDGGYRSRFSMYLTIITLSLNLFINKQLHDCRFFGSLFENKAQRHAPFKLDAINALQLSALSLTVQ